MAEDNQSVQSKTLERMKADGLQRVVASSATTQELNLLLKAAQVEDLIEAATISSDAEFSKPAPDIVEAALDEVG